MSTTRSAKQSWARKRLDRDAGGAEWSIEGTRNCCAGTEIVLLCFSGEGMFVSALCHLRVRCSCLQGGVSHEFHRELAPFGAARVALLFNSACARAVFAIRVRCSCLQGGVSHEFHRELAPFGAARVARLFNSACARAVFATVDRVRCSQRVGAGTFVGEGMNTLHPTGLATRNEAPVGTILGGLGGVSNTIDI